MVLASNEEEQKLQLFMEQNGYNFPVYRMVQNPPEVFQTSSIPTTFLITQDGRITVRKTGSAKWDGRFFSSYLEKVLE